jgi:hypothetical protein
MYWTIESWGADCPPENAEEIISRANELIDAYAAQNGNDEAENYSEMLWEHYCTTGDLDMPWYAVQRDADDNDWGTGSFYYAVAVEMARRYGSDARIAVIELGNDPVCVRVILAEDF